MKTRLLAFVLAVGMCLGFYGLAEQAHAAESSAAKDDFLAFVADESRSDYTLSGDIDLGGQAVTIARRVSIDGNGHTITGGTLTFTNASGSQLGDFTVQNANGDAITLANSPNVRLQNLSVIGSAGYGLVAKSPDVRTSASVNLALTMRGNASGGILLQDNSLITLAGSTAVLSFENYVYIDEAKQQAYQEGTYRDKNFDKADRINVVCLTENGSFIKRDSDKINTISFEKEGHAYTCHIYAYDDVAPEVGVLGAPKSIVTGTALDLKTAVTVQDNRSSTEEMLVRFSALYTEDGTPIALTEKTDVFVNGSVLLAEKKGRIELKAEVTDEYGNASTRYLYIDAVPENSTPPTIQAETLQKVYTVGKAFRLPAFTAKDAQGNSVSTVVEVTDSRGNTQRITQDSYTFTTSGSYVITVSATDTYGNTAEKRYYVSATVEAQTQTGAHKEPFPLAPLVVLIIAVVSAVGIVVWNLLLRRKKS